MLRSADSHADRQAVQIGVNRTCTRQINAVSMRHTVMGDTGTSVRLMAA